EVHTVIRQAVAQARRAELLDELQIGPPMAVVATLFEQIAANAPAAPRPAGDERVRALDPRREREVPRASPAAPRSLALRRRPPAIGRRLRDLIGGLPLQDVQKAVGHGSSSRDSSGCETGAAGGRYPPAATGLALFRRGARGRAEQNPHFCGKFAGRRWVRWLCFDLWRF